MLQSLCQVGRSGLLLASRGGGYGYWPRRPLLPAARSLCMPRPSTSLAQWLARDLSHNDGSGPGAANPVTWYACGPTVYDAAHLGHARYAGTRVDFIQLGREIGCNRLTGHGTYMFGLTEPIDAPACFD